MPPCALVTGASRGLGRALSLALAKEGWALLLTARQGDRLRELAEACLQAGAPEAWPLAGAIEAPEHRTALAEAAQARWGRLDALVNNAAQLGDPSLPPLLTQDLARLEALLQVNLLAPLGLIQACAPLLGAGACVVNLSSDAAGGAFPGWGAYGLTKAALEHASATLAEEAPTWRVHWVDPGEMATDMYAEHLPGDLSHLPSPEDFAVPLLLELLTQPQASGFREALPPAQAGRTIRGPLLPSPNSSPPAPPW